MLSPQLEAGIRWDNLRGRGQVVCQMEGYGRQRRDFMYEGGGRISQGCAGVVSVPWVLGLVRSRVPVEVEEEIRLRGNLPTRHQGGTVGREGGTGFREVCSGRVYLRRGADEP